MSGLFGTLIFAIIARLFCGNYIKRFFVKLLLNGLFDMVSVKCSLNVDESKKFSGILKLVVLSV